MIWMQVLLSTRWIIVRVNRLDEGRAEHCDGNRPEPSNIQNKKCDHQCQYLRNTNTLSLSTIIANPWQWTSPLVIDDAGPIGLQSRSQLGMPLQKPDIGVCIFECYRSFV